MKRERKYEGVRFPVRVLEESIARWKKGLHHIEEDDTSAQLLFYGRPRVGAALDAGRDRWWPETIDGFLADYAQGNHDSAYIELSGGLIKERFEFTAQGTTVKVVVDLPADDDAKAVLYVFDSNFDDARAPRSAVITAIRRDVTVFVGHGRDTQWRDLKDHLRDKQGFKHVTAT